MLFEEAAWIGNEIQKLVGTGNIQRVLNIGSSTRESWETEQNHVETYVINRIKNAGVRLVNTDIKKGEGVDIAGDLNDLKLIGELSEMDFNLVICANLLEHVKDPGKIALNISRIVKPDNFIIVTVPRIYPYHPDPEDYLFRPDAIELIKYFKGFDLVTSAEVRGKRAINHKGKTKYYSCYFQVLLSQPKQLLITIVRLLTPFYKYANWKKTACYLPKIFQKFSVTCIVLVRKDSSNA